MGGWVLATAGSNASSQVDIISRAIAIGSLVVAIGSVAVTWYLWRRSGSDLAVAVLRDSVEVSNVGRINSVVRRVYIDIQAKTRWSEGQDQMSKYVDVFDLEFPDGSEQA